MYKKYKLVEYSQNTILFLQVLLFKMFLKFVNIFIFYFDNDVEEKI